MNVDLVQTGARVVIDSANHHRSMVRTTVAAATVVVTVEAAKMSETQLGLSPRRFFAGVVMLTGLSLARRAARILPVDAPTRVYMDGHLSMIPVSWRDLPAFARSRVTLSELVP